MSNNMPRQSREKSGTGIYQMIIRTVPLILVEVVNAKAGNPSASFNMTNADTDGNGSLTEADITAIVNIIMK